MEKMTLYVMRFSVSIVLGRSFIQLTAVGGPLCPDTGLGAGMPCEQGRSSRVLVEFIVWEWVNKIIPKCDKSLKETDMVIENK